LKTLELAGDRLTVGDLGPGSYADFSPEDERVIFLLEPESAPGAAAGLWLMNGDGKDRRMLGGLGRPRWSPDSRQFMIIGSSEPCEVTVMDVRPEKSGLVQVADHNLFFVPSWAGEGTLVAVIGSDAGDTIALVDVNEPAQAKVKEVLWKRGQGSEVRPSFPVYSPVTRRCVFVGMEEGKGRALYSFEAGKPGPPKRLESRPYDKTLEDLALSPDGRYVVFCSDRLWGVRAPGARVQSADAPALSGITIDGDLADWPAAMPRYPIQNMQPFPPANGLGRREHAFLTTGADLSACFSVGYDPKEQVIYLAVIVRDDQLIVGNTSPMDGDSIEVYIDGLHTNTIFPFPQDPSWSENMDAGEPPVLQYIGIPGKGPVYGVRKSAGQERSGEDNPILNLGDIKKTKTRMAFRRAGDVTTYEWAIQAFDHYPDKPTKLLPGVQIGFDVVVSDKDKPAQTPQANNDPEEDRASWVCWGPPWRRLKYFDAGNLGEIVLGRAPGR
jgi:Tol biopolymer transport system component